MIEVGTRSRFSALNGRTEGGSMTRSATRDVGMSKLATASMTFGGGEVSAANGTFSAFQAGDVVLAEGTNLNNGFFDVTGIDTVNGAYLDLAPPPKAEGPLTATVRTS